MKFGKSLSNQIELTLPEWRDKFLSYKELKKRLKRIGVGGENNGGDGGRTRKHRRIEGSGGDGRLAEDEEEINGAMTEEEVGFIKLLEDELDKFNSFFVEREEEYIIRLKELQDRVSNAKESNEEMMLQTRKEIVDFHGEMVLLENYSALNYTGLVKILKKHDKRTGALIRLPFIQRVLHQPVFTTDLLNMLVKECERTLDVLFPTITVGPMDEQCDPTTSKASGSSTGNGILLQEPKELAEIEYMENLYMKSTISALKALQEIRSRSSTVSMFSLPPIQLSGLEDTSKTKIPALEQAADKKTLCPFS